MMKRLAAGAALILVGLTFAARKMDVLTEVRTAFAVGLSLIGVSLANIWAWLPANMATLTGLAGLAVAGVTFYKMLLEVRKLNRDLNRRRGDEAE